MTIQPPPIRSQQERSRITQQRLLDATVECLITHGWAGTTTTLVAETAGVSRGAQLHHYPTKATLVLAAVEHLTTRRADEIRTEAAENRARSSETLNTTTGIAGTAAAPSIDRAVDLLAAQFTGPLFAAALEIWVGARTDKALRDALLPLEATLGRQLYRLTVDVLGADDSRPEVRDAIQATLELLRGLGVAGLLSDDSGRRATVLRGWARHLATVLRVEETSSL